MAASHIFKVVFVNQGKVYEIYARKVSHGSLFGFVEHLRLGGEVDELIFAVLGVAFVLVIGTIWRRRKLEEMAATSTEAEVAPATT